MVVVDANGSPAQDGGVPARVVFVVFDRVQPLDVGGPHEVFAGAGHLVPGGGYELVVAAPAPGPVRSESGLGLVADASIGDLTRSRTPIDTLLVAGGDGVHSFRAEPANLDALRRLARGSRRITAVCTGAFALASAGLLDGRRATTHWARASRLAEEFPAVTVDARALYVRDGDVWTSAGVTAGIDLALALVEEDHGPAVARHIARWLVVFLRRPGDQGQFSGILATEPGGPEVVRAVCRFIQDHPGADLSIAALAARASMSPRHFERVFTRETGTSPGRHVETVRLDAARAELESGLDVAGVARRCGFGTTETMRRSFVRRLGVSPAAYRQRFSKGA
ncbi:MAG: GlxA family transcriptional regulator [Acidimicrobiales bacterium]